MAHLSMSPALQDHPKEKNWDALFHRDSKRTSASSFSGSSEKN